MHGVRTGMRGSATLFAAWTYHRLVDRMSSREAYEQVGDRFGLTVKALKYLAYREQWNALASELLPAVWVRRASIARNSER
jgi:hypothetical protein